MSGLTRPPRRRFRAAACLSAAIACAILNAPALHANPVVPQQLPDTVPSIREWSGGGTDFRLATDARVIADAELSETARLLATDLTAAGKPATPGGAARTGDIVLRLDAAAPAAAEGYRISVGDQLTITATTRLGIIHGTQTALQWLRRTDAVPGGTARDWPDYPERGLMLDTAREFFPVDWVKARIREAAYLRMNLLQLHLSDSLGFRLASTTHPEITSPEHYTAADIREIVDYAAAYGIEIIPEIDMPSHMNVILAGHPDLILQPQRTSATDAIQDSLIGGGIPGKVDLTNPDAYRLVEDILREFIPLFPGRYWHIGCDEYVSDYSRYPQLSAYAARTIGPDAVAGDVIVAFANWAAGIVESFGKIPRAWNDGFDHAAALTPKSEIVVQYWSSSAGGLPWLPGGRTPEEFTRRGNPILNAAFTPTYFASGGWAANLNAPPELLWAWDPGLFVNGQRLPESDRRLLRGSMVFLWCDDPTVMTPDQIVGPLRARLPVMAQHLWTGMNGISYPELVRRTNSAGLP